MPDPDNARQGLSCPKIRIHQDIVLNTSTLVDAEDLLLVLPAQTRYESGGTSPSTERRIRYSPVVDDPDGVAIPEARAEWEIPSLIGRALRPDRPSLFPYRNTDEVRREMGELMPLYQGIEGLKAEGEFVQWGGARLGQNGFPNMPDSRAAFTTVGIPTTHVPEGKFLMTSRRGKQFNSITYGKKDPITGLNRKDVIFAAADLNALGLRDGDRVILRSELGELRARARSGPCRLRHLQAFWPESNVLTGRRYDPVSGEPDYNAVVSVERA